MKVQQRDVIELNYELPNGKFKTHPALVISNSNVLETEVILYAVMISLNPMNEEFNFGLYNSMLTKPLPKRSFVKCQLIHRQELLNEKKFFMNGLWRKWRVNTAIISTRIISTK